jgi:hypothetical protein
VKSFTGPTPDNGQPIESYNYTYDAAGDQTQWKPQLSTNTSWNVTRSYWPSGQVATLKTTDVGNTIQHNFTFLDWPSGAQAGLTGTVNGGSTTHTEALTYFPDGHLQKLNDKLSGTIPSGYPTGGYDSLYTYDVDGNVLTRQQGGTLSGSTYSGGTLAKFGSYNGNDQETSLTITGNDTSAGTQPTRQFTTTYWPSGQPQTRTRIQCSTAPCTGTPISENYFYNDDGTISQDNRSSDNKNQSYSYDTDGNRITDEIGNHQYNALDQETQWSRSGTQNQANSGSNVNYLLDGTGGLLRQIDDAGGLFKDSTGNSVPVRVTTWYCSAGTIGSVKNTTYSTTQYSTGCQHDDDRVETVNAVSWDTTKLTIAAPLLSYCYDSLGYLARITKTTTCPSTDSAVQNFALQTGETQSTTSVYQHDSFGDQTGAITTDAKSVPSSSSPTLDLDCFSYDGLDRRYVRTQQQFTTGWPSKPPTCPNSTATTTTSYGYVGQSNQIALEKNAGAVPQIYDYNSTGQKMGVWEGPNSAYYSYALDAKGSIEGLERATTCPTGTNPNLICDTDRYHYTPYGNLEKGQAQGGGQASNTTMPEASLGGPAQSNNYRFEGFYEDSGIGTYDLLARNYLPQGGTYSGSTSSPGSYQPSQFTAADAFESALGDQELRADPLTQNLYAFAGGNPTNNLEWDGHGPNCATGPCPFTTASGPTDVPAVNKYNGAPGVGENDQTLANQTGPSSGYSGGCIAACSSSSKSSGPSFPASVLHLGESAGSGLLNLLHHGANTVTGTGGQGISAAGGFLGNQISALGCSLKVASLLGCPHSSPIEQETVDRGGLASNLAASALTLASIIPLDRVIIFAAKLPGLSSVIGDLAARSGAAFGRVTAATDVATTDLVHQSLSNVSEGDSLWDSEHMRHFSPVR